jgi:hypothetical protein
MGQVKVFGSSPKVVEHPQNIFDRVRSWACTSRPMTGSYSIRHLLGKKGCTDLKI